MRKPGQARAEAYVISTVAEMVARGQRRLPPLETLAEKSGVGRATMWRALRELVRRGVLFSRRGSGVFVAQPHSNESVRVSESDPSPDRPEAPSRRAADRLRRDIYAVRHTPNTLLPPTKELAAMYGVCTATIRKALRTLLSEQLVEAIGRRFRPALLPGQVAGNRIALIRRRFPSEDRVNIPIRQLEDLQILESECQRLGLKVSSVLCEHRGSRVAIRSDHDGVFSSRGDLASVMGFLVWPSTFRAEGFAGLWKRIAATGMPTAVMCSASSEHFDTVTGTGGATALVRTSDNFLAGHAVGRYVFGLGYRQAAFIDGSGGCDWSRARLAGLKQAFAEAGHDKAITACVGSLKQPLHSIEAPKLPFVRRCLAELDKMAVDDGSEEMRLLTAKLQPSVRVASHQAVHRANIEEAVSEAFTREDIGVWVCDNDQTAIECMAYLREHGQDSRPISVVGFDNTVESLLQGLTSYEFGYGEALRTALGFLLRPKSFGRRMRGVYRFQSKGFVVQRSSVHPVGRN